MNYVVFETGSKQYKASEGETLRVEKLPGKEKEKITLDKVLLLVNDQEVLLGQPYLKNVKLTAEIIAQEKAKKVRVVKFKAKSRYRRVTGHRQQLTRIKLVKIGLATREKKS